MGYQKVLMGRKIISLTGIEDILAEINLCKTRRKTSQCNAVLTPVTTPDKL